jgi:hypothetical protein
MEDNLIILANGKPSNYGKWKTTSIISQMGEYLNILGKGRQPQYSGKWKTTSTSIC